MCRSALFQGCVSGHYSFNLLVYNVQKWSLAQQQSCGIYCKMSSCVCVWPFLYIKIFFSLICKRHRNRCDYGHSLNKDYPLLLIRFVFWCSYFSSLMFVTTAVLETFVEHLEKLPSQNKFHRLTKISPTANRDSVRRGNIFSNEHIFPAEWDNVFLPWRWKILHDYFIHSNNNFITDLFIKGLKKLFFCLDVSKDMSRKKAFLSLNL